MSSTDTDTDSSSIVPSLISVYNSHCSPAGWDSLKKISILYENMHAVKAENHYTDIIKAPPTRKVSGLDGTMLVLNNNSNLALQTVSNRETEVQTEDEQAFLARQQEILKQGGQVRGESPLRSQGGSAGGNKSGPRTPGSTGQSSPKKVSQHTHCAEFHNPSYSFRFQIDPKLTPATPGNEGVLANFFNSLLHKKTGGPAGGPAGAASPGGGMGTPRTSNGTDTLMTAEKLAVRSDAAAELDRLARSVNKNIDMSQSEC